MRVDIENKESYIFQNSVLWSGFMNMKNIIWKRIRWIYATLFIGSWLIIIMIERVVNKVHLVYAIENGMKEISWCNCVWYKTIINILFMYKDINNTNR